MQYKISELEGALLDAAVAKAEGYSSVRIREAADRPVCEIAFQMLTSQDPRWVAHEPHRQWSLGGPIIEREEIDLVSVGNGWRAGHSLEQWQVDAGFGGSFGPTPLIAAMRAYIASRFGDVVELP
jgi:hypothetical protein